MKYGENGYHHFKVNKTTIIVLYTNETSVLRLSIHHANPRSFWKQASGNKINRSRGCIGVKGTLGQAYIISV